jgi:replication-associated recombination protein RarA
MRIHHDIEERIKKYVSHGLLNTIFHGPKGSGKHSIVLKMLNSLNSNLYEKEKVRQWEETGITFYSTSTYIRFDAKECIRKKANLPKIIEEIGRTRDISADSNKVIYIRYLNYLGDQQEAFRQLVEDTYLSCRYVFTCRNIDSVDPALISRCFLVRIPSPTREILKNFINDYKPNININTSDDLTEELKEKLIDMCNGNLNTLQNLILLQLKNSEPNPPDVLKEFCDQIFKDCSNLKNLSNIQSISEKIHYSEFSILDICKRMDNKQFFINDLQKYAAIQSPSLYDTMRLITIISKSVNKKG